MLWFTKPTMNWQWIVRASYKAVQMKGQSSGAAHRTGGWIWTGLLPLASLLEDTSSPLPASLPAPLSFWTNCTDISTEWDKSLSDSPPSNLTCTYRPWLLWKSFYLVVISTILNKLLNFNFQSLPFCSSTEVFHRKPHKFLNYSKLTACP